MKNPNNKTSAPVIALLSNTAWSMYNFRKGLLRSLAAEGYEVVVVAPEDGYGKHIEALGCRFEPVSINRYQASPVDDWRYFMQLRRIFKKRGVQFAISYTIKPNIYGSVLCYLMGISVIAVVTGLGQLFTNPSWKTKLIKPLYRFALGKARQIWFLNREDQAIFNAMGLAPARSSFYLPSEGVDTAFLTSNYINGKSPDHFTFLFAGRLMEEKGVRDFVAAAGIVKKTFPNVAFEMLGFIESDYPTAIGIDEIRDWEQQGLIRFLGATDDIKTHLQRSDCLVLPTYYREGAPKILLEAASMEKTIITTDNVGCRDIVQHGVNGYLCNIKDPENLAHWMLQLLKLPYGERRLMGQRSRAIVVQQFDEKLIIQRYLNVLADCLEHQAPAGEIHAAPAIVEIKDERFTYVEPS